MELTKQEFYNKYGDIKVKLFSFALNKFTLRGRFKDGLLSITIGGTHHTYSLVLSQDATYTAKDFDCIEGTVWDNKGEVVDHTFFEEEVDDDNRR